MTPNGKDVATWASLITLSESTFWSGINWEALAGFALFLNTRYLSLSQLQFSSQGGILPYHTPYFASRRILLKLVDLSPWNPFQNRRLSFCFPPAFWHISLALLFLWVLCSEVNVDVSPVHIILIPVWQFLLGLKLAVSSPTLLLAGIIFGCLAVDAELLIDCAVFNLIKCFFLWWWAAVFCSQSKPDVVGLLNACSRLVPHCSNSIFSAAELISSA